MQHYKRFHDLLLSLKKSICLPWGGLLCTVCCYLNFGEILIFSVNFANFSKTFEIFCLGEFCKTLNHSKLEKRPCLWQIYFGGSKFCIMKILKCSTKFLCSQILYFCMFFHQMLERKKLLQLYFGPSF